MRTKVCVGPALAAACAIKNVEYSQPVRESRTIPATAVITTSQPPACTGLPPMRTSRRSTGRMTGSVNARSARPTAPKDEMRRVRTSQDPSAMSAARTTRPKMV